MEGFYSLCTKNSSKASSYRMRDYEFLTMALSVCEWQKHNGDAYMYADQVAKDYLESTRIADIFRGGVRPLKVPDNINTNMFWAAGKIFALRQIDRPMAMIDLDLIIWKSLDKSFEGKDVFVIHREELSESTYPDVSRLSMKKDYVFDKSWDMSVKPCNTALLYIADDAFRQYYCDEAIRFMSMASDTDDRLWHMVFAEQRLLPILASLKGKQVDSYFGLASDIGKQDVFTHVWGHKSILRYNYNEKVKYCDRIMGRLERDYPQVYQLCRMIYKEKCSD